MYFKEQFLIVVRTITPYNEQVAQIETNHIHLQVWSNTWGWEAHQRPGHEALLRPRISMHIELEQTVPQPPVKHPTLVPEWTCRTPKAIKEQILLWVESTQKRWSHISPGDKTWEHFQDVFYRRPEMRETKDHSRAHTKKIDRVYKHKPDNLSTHKEARHWTEPITTR